MEIRLTSDRPIEIVQDDWLMLVSATSFKGQTESEDRKRSLFVLISKKCHAKKWRMGAKYIVYGSGPDANNRMMYAGHIVYGKDHDLIEGIQKVAEEIDDKSLAIACIQGLPPRKVRADY